MSLDKLIKDNSMPDVATLEGGAPLTDAAQLIVDIVKDLPESTRRLFATPEGWALVVGAAATALGFSAIDFDNAMAMVKSDHLQSLGVDVGDDDSLDLGTNGKLYVDQGRVKDGHESYFVVDSDVQRESDGNTQIEGILSGLGLGEVDSVIKYPAYSNPLTDQVLANVHAASIRDTGHYFSPDAYVVRLVDAELKTANTVPGYTHLQRGGFVPIEKEATNLVFAKIAGTDQMVVGLAVDADGKLSGFKTGEENAKVFGLQLGQGEWGDMLGITINIDGQDVFQPLIDCNTGTILIPNGDIVDGVSQFNANGGGGKPLAALAEFAGYVSPEFVNLQNEVAKHENFTLTSLEDGILFEGSPIPGLEVNRAGDLLLTVGGETVVLDPADVNFDDENGISIDGYDWDEEVGGWVETAPEKVLTEIALCETMYDTLTADNNLNPEHMHEASELQNIANWVQSQLTEGMFDPSKIKPLSEVGLETPFILGNKVLVPNHETAPNYEDPTTAPFLKENNPWCGSTMIDGKPHLVVYIPYYIEGVDPSEYPVITGVKELKEGFRGNWRRAVELYADRMNVVPWNLSEDSIKLTMQYLDPETGENFTRSRIQQIFKEMEKGDFSHTHGLVLYYTAATSQIQAFE